MECIMEEYLKYTNNFLTDYFKLLLDKQYDKKIVTPFISSVYVSLIFLSSNNVFIKVLILLYS